MKNINLENCFENLSIDDLEEISAGGSGGLAYDIFYSIGKKLKDNYCKRKGFHYSESGIVHGGGGRHF